MEEVEDAAACVRKRKRKRDGDVASGAGAGVGVVSGEAGLEGPECCFSWKELGLGEEEGMEYEGIAEESVEVMRWLEMEISVSPGKDDCGFVTINGNEESCGPSFSAAASTVMASVDTRAGAPPPPTPIPWPWPEPARDEDDQAKAVVDDDGLDEEWLLDLLTTGGEALDVFSLE